MCVWVCGWVGGWVGWGGWGGARGGGSSSRVGGGGRTLQLALHSLLINCSPQPPTIIRPCPSAPVPRAPPPSPPPQTQRSSAGGGVPSPLGTCCRHASAHSSTDCLVLPMPQPTCKAARSGMETNQTKCKSVATNTVQRFTLTQRLPSRASRTAEGIRQRHATGARQPIHQINAPAQPPTHPRTARPS